MWVSPCSAQLHLSSGGVVVIGRERNEYMNARQKTFLVVSSVPLTVCSTYALNDKLLRKFAQPDVK